MIFLRSISCPEEIQVASVQLDTDISSEGDDAQLLPLTDDSSDNEDDDSSTDTDSADKECMWSIVYDNSIYESNIAVEKVPHSNITVLQWLCMNFNLFTAHPSMSKEAFSTNLQLQKVLNTTNNSTYELPSTYREARKMINPYVIKKKVFKLCTNSCVCFRNDYQNLKKCPDCNSDKK